MRAIVINGKEDLTLAELPVPDFRDHGTAGAGPRPGADPHRLRGHLRL